MTKIEQAVGFDRQEYEELKQTAKDSGIQILHLRKDDWNTEDCNSRTGGATIAWSRVNASSKSKMIEVAIAWCNPKDVFCRRIGSWLALGMFVSENTILIPIGNEDNSVVVDNLRFMFGKVL